MSYTSLIGIALAATVIGGSIIYGANMLITEQRHTAWVAEKLRERDAIAARRQQAIDEWRSRNHCIPGIHYASGYC